MFAVILVCIFLTMVCQRCEVLEDIAKLQDKLDNIADKMSSAEYIKHCDNNRKNHLEFTARDCECSDAEDCHVSYLFVYAEGLPLNERHTYYYEEVTGIIYKADDTEGPVDPVEVGSLMWAHKNIYTEFFYCDYNDILWN